MIPKIQHSRSQLYSYFQDFEDGARSFGISCDTYPALFEQAHVDIVSLAPNGWRSNSKGNLRYLWFPPGALSEDHCESIEDWRKRFTTYVLIGLNEHIEDHFSDELDFCMALDFNFDPQADRRTLYGEAVYLLKYRQSRQHNKVLADGLIEAFDDLPIPSAELGDVLVTYAPTNPGGQNIPRGLAKALAAKLKKTFCRSDLTCPKKGLKGVRVDEKIPIWEDLYQRGCVNLSESVSGKTIVIVDDLYQSGATMWMFARNLKHQGAKYVLGLPCVKPLRDTDNQ